MPLSTNWLPTLLMISPIRVRQITMRFQSNTCFLFVAVGANVHQQLNVQYAKATDVHSFIHSAISIAPLPVLYYSEALMTTARILYRSFTPKCTGNCRTCPRSLRGG